MLFLTSGLSTAPLLHVLATTVALILVLSEASSWQQNNRSANGQIFCSAYRHAGYDQQHRLMVDTKSFVHVCCLTRTYLVQRRYLVPIGLCIVETEVCRHVHMIRAYRL